MRAAMAEADALRRARIAAEEKAAADKAAAEKAAADKAAEEKAAADKAAEQAKRAEKESLAYFSKNPRVAHKLRALCYDSMAVLPQLFPCDGASSTSTSPTTSPSQSTLRSIDD